MTTTQIDEIKVNDRQRKELKDIDDLADSINRLGLIQPIVTTRDNELVAGERRLIACKQLGWTSIPIHYTDELDPLQLHLIELEENTKRLDLTWQEECAAVAEYHNLRKEIDPEWTENNTAKALGIAQQTANARIQIAEELRNGNELVMQADRMSTAKNIVVRKRERMRASALEGISDTPKPEVPLFNVDFHEWIDTYAGPKFNFIHCDFPYGIQSSKHNQGASDYMGGYEDSVKVSQELMLSLARATETIVADSAHLMFWFSMDYYQNIKELLEAIDWDVNPFPLIWHKTDNSGILPDPHRGPRRIYETAFMASRGDRKIVQAVSNVFGGPTTKEIHMSEKPKPMLKHFFRMFVDENSYMLDPTCGSGNAVAVADGMQAKLVVGLEKDEEFYNLAREKYEV